MLRPKHWRSCHQYPFSHPMDRQCQLVLPAVEQLRNGSAWKRLARRHSGAAAVEEVFLATLGPGDVLLQPNHWLHQVQAQGISASVNVWTYSPSDGIIQELGASLERLGRGAEIDAPTALAYLTGLVSKLYPRSRLRGEVHKRVPVVNS